MNSRNGFSLIELMVVIAIVATLVSIAMPSYKDYLIQTRVSTIASFMGSLVEKSITKYERVGEYATAYDLGLAAVQATNNVQDSLQIWSNGSAADNNIVAEISPYITSIFISEPTNVNTSYISVILNPSALGFSSAVGQADLACVFYLDPENIYQKQCFYETGS
jgi:prepilin-type N-terminal cleavage/methylation domain-containing protein